MSKLQQTDINFDGVARGINSLDPINNQDLVTKAYFEALRYRVDLAQATTLNTFASIALCGRTSAITSAPSVGFTSTGTTATQAHTHDTASQAHTHGVVTSTGTTATQAHTHTVTSTGTSGSTLSATQDFRPKYINCKFICRIK